MTLGDPEGPPSPSAADFSQLLAPRPVALVTPSLPGTGGRIRATEADFRVEELALYEPCGDGDHLIVEVEKQGRTTPEVAAELARALGAPEREVGYAGLKDKRAVTVQRFSLPMPKGTAGPAAAAQAAAHLEAARALVGPGYRVLSATRHTNKLRTGHLRGNRFTIAIRDTGPEALARAQAVARALEGCGAANLFGPQRFGARGDNAALGAALLSRLPEGLRAARNRFLRRLSLSALQAELFNRCLSARVSEGSFGTALRGDVLRKRESGGLFLCQDPAVDGPRCASGELDPAGPLPGHAGLAAEGEVAAREASVLAEARLDPACFRAGGGEMEGTRRPYRIPIDDLEVGEATDGAGGLLLRFSLPKGSYAACVLREVMKIDATFAGVDE